MKAPIHVHQLDRSHLPLMHCHFGGLGPEDRRLRFGTALPTQQIAAYVDAIPFERDVVLGVYGDDLDLIGVAHLACWPGAAELGLSVLPNFRGTGIGSALFERAVTRARNLQIVELFMHCLAQNDTILHIARKAGMRVLFEESEADAFLELSPGNALTLSQEMVDRHLAWYDWAGKAFACPRNALLQALR